LHLMGARSSFCFFSIIFFEKSAAMSLFRPHAEQSNDPAQVGSRTGVDIVLCGDGHAALPPRV
jgi:hypothetical protein